MKLFVCIVVAEMLIAPRLYGTSASDTLRSPLQIEYEHALEFASEEGSVTPLLEAMID